MKVNNLDEVDVSNYDYIAVDEFQFYEKENTVGTVLDWVTTHGKCVLIASLDGDAFRRPFGSVLNLVPHADVVTKLTAYCDICRDNYKMMVPAPFTGRMTSEKTATLVGGADIYKAMCRKCHDFHLEIM
jgi:thymidine kinase